MKNWVDLKRKHMKPKKKKNELGNKWKEKR